MKKTISVILVLMMMFTLVACGNSAAGNRSSTADESSTTETAENTTTPENESTENRESSSAVSEEPEAGSNVLVAYFSWSSSHNTQTMAEYVADATGGELFQIEPETAYTTNYNDVIDVAQEEQDANARPALAKTLTQEQLDAYDVVFIGYPVWWYDAPMIIYSFMESLDFADKTVVTFATSGGSGISDNNLQSAVSANYLEGLCIPNFSAGGSARTRVNEWIAELGFAQ